MLLVTALNAPRVVARVTVPPLLVTTLPLASFRVTVIVEVEVPLAVIVLGLALMVEVEALAAPAAKTTFAVWLTVIVSVESVAV